MPDALVAPRDKSPASWGVISDCPRSLLLLLCLCELRTYYKFVISTAANSCPPSSLHETQLKLGPRATCAKLLSNDDGACMQQLLAQRVALPCGHFAINAGQSMPIIVGLLHQTLK